MYEKDDIKRKILRVIDELEKYNGYYEKQLGFAKVEAVSIDYALELYRRTLLDITRRRSIEPLSSLYVSPKRPARITWTTKKVDIGEEVTVSADAEIREELVDALVAFEEANYKLGSTGGIFTTIPNKSYTKVAKLLKLGYEYVWPIVRLGAQSLWIDIWTQCIFDRYIASHSMLELKDKHMKDVFSHGNEGAGCGIAIRGKKLKRKDLDEIPAAELAFLLDHMVLTGVLFAATQCVVPKGNKVWLTTYMDPRVTGAVGARSDGDIEDAVRNGNNFSTHSNFLCRQIFSNGGGTLSNSITEKKNFGKSVLHSSWETILDMTATTDYLYPPFRGFDNLVEFWTSDTYDSAKGPEDLVLIGEDIGMAEPLKAGADTLFCGNFQRIGYKTMPDLTSGFWGTAQAYFTMHVHWARKFAAAGIDFKAIPLGDDFNLLLKRKDYTRAIELLKPYDKIKSTSGTISKILGMMTTRANGKWKTFVTPRIQKTVASATQAASDWADILPGDLPDQGELTLSVPEKINDAVEEALPIVKTLVYNEATTKEELRIKLRQAWGQATHIKEFYEFLPGWMQYLAI